MSMIEQYAKLNAPTLRADKQKAIVEFCKDIMKQRIFQILWISTTAIYLSTSPAFSWGVYCEEFRASSASELSHALCSSHTYIFPENYALDTYSVKKRIYEIFSDETGNIETDMSRELVDSLVIELEWEDFIPTTLPWIQEIQKYTGLLPTNDNIIEFVNLQIYLKKGNYSTAKSLIEGIIINAQSPYFMKKAFENLHLIPDEV